MLLLCMISGVTTILLSHELCQNTDCWTQMIIKLRSEIWKKVLSSALASCRRGGLLLEAWKCRFKSLNTFQNNPVKLTNIKITDGDWFSFNVSTNDNLAGWGNGGGTDADWENDTQMGRFYSWILSKTDLYLFFILLVHTSTWQFFDHISSHEYLFQTLPFHLFIDSSEGGTALFQKAKWLAKQRHLINDAFCLLILGKVTFVPIIQRCQDIME